MSQPWIAKESMRPRPRSVRQGQGARGLATHRRRGLARGRGAPVDVRDEVRCVPQFVPCSSLTLSISLPQPAQSPHGSVEGAGSRRQWHPRKPWPSATVNEGVAAFALVRRFRCKPMKDRVAWRRWHRRSGVPAVACGSNLGLSPGFVRGPDLASGCPPAGPSLPCGQSRFGDDGGTDSEPGVVG
jgi:hypothetical protein